MKDFDLCVVGSGAGAGPVILSLAQAGYSVVVLEKGPWFHEQDFFKDELACCRRSVYTPKLKDERHVIEEQDGNGKWLGESTEKSGWDFWNGNCVGGSSNFMSGFFYRLKPEDFRLLSTFGPISGANQADWPIAYSDLEPYYTKVEQEVGISGRVTAHPYAEPRSTPDFPYPPTVEHTISDHFDTACNHLGLHPLPTPRAVLSRPAMGRQSCAYSGYCGSYGCATGAKGSSRAALLNRAIATGNCQIYPYAKVHMLRSNTQGQVVSAVYFDAENKIQQVSAKVFVVACQAIETARLLLLSKGPQHPQGLANRYGQVGKNLLFSAGGFGSCDFPYAGLDPDKATKLRQIGPFVNRNLQDWYFYNDSTLGRVKGGTIDFLFQHPNPIAQANHQKWSGDKLIWGKPLKSRLKAHFHAARLFRFEVFCDWLPTNNCFVSIDPKVKDQWGSPVARVRVGHHPHDLKIGRYLANQAEIVFKAMQGKNISSQISGSPPPNLVAGGCRFGTDPKHSVLNADCRAHEVENLYVTDGSFMPTGGSVPFTWTIYANAFRVADRIIAELGGREDSKV